MSGDIVENRRLTEDEVFRTPYHSTTRRGYLRKNVLSCLFSAAAIATTTMPPLAAIARGLVQFPCTTPLFNTYHIMRAGTSLLEEEDIWSTNPLFLTNAEAALSEKGRAEVEAAVRKLKDANIQPSVIKYSLAASAMDTTTIVRDELKVGQNRVVPEFFFMDPRAVGAYDMMSIQQTLPAIIALDEAEAGKDGAGGRPPPNEDGTPNETLADNSIRLRQLVSGTSSLGCGCGCGCRLYAMLTYTIHEESLYVHKICLVLILFCNLLNTCRN